MRTRARVGRGIPAGVTLGLAACLWIGFGCSGGDHAPGPGAVAQTTGEVMAASACGGFPVDEDAPRAANTKDCIEYAYDGAGTLALRHVNAGLNCCPGTITVPATVSNGRITLDETGMAADCRCDCRFDIDLEIRGLGPGIYELNVLEPLTGPGDEPLRFELDLRSATSGVRCVARTHYPWGDYF